MTRESAVATSDVASQANPPTLAAPWALAILVAWVCLNYAWTLPFGFTNDDWTWIYGVSHLHQRPQEFVVPGLYAGKFFRPFVQLTFAFNYLTSGLDPYGYRLLNVLAHLGVTLLLWRLALAARLRPAAALVAAMAFAVQPTRTDSVVWISGRTEVLCALFFVAAVLAELRERTLWALLLFVGALVSKETAVCLPLIVVLGESLLRTPEERRYGRVLPYLGVLLIYAVVRSYAVHYFAADIMGITATGAPPLTLPQVVGVFRTKVTLLGEYVFGPLPVHGLWRSVLLLAGGSALALWGTRPGPNRTAARYGLGWTVITLLPYAGWVMFQRWYVYFAVIGTSLAAAAIGADVIGRLRAPTLRRLAAVVAASAWLVASAAELRHYNRREWRAGAVSEEVERALSAVVRPYAPRTMFIAAGLAPYVFGTDPGLNGRPTMILGLTEAIRMLVHDEYLDVDFGDLDAARRLSGERPVVFVEWDDTGKRFHRTWQSF